MVSLLVLMGCGKTEPPSRSAAPRKPRVSVQESVARDLEYAVEAAGSIEAAEEISVPASVSGVVDAVHFKEGDAVDPATVLVEIDVEKYRLGEERAKAEFERARAQAELAETVFKNRRTLYEEGKKRQKEWVTEEQMATWRADVEKAKAEQERSRVDLELARRSHRDARVRPPIAGLINRKWVSKGEYVKGETVVASILNVSTLYVRFTVSELEAARLKVGQEAAFALRSAPGAGFKAKLFYMNQKADPATRSVECKAEVLGRNAVFRAGTFAAVRIVTEKKKSIVVPERAVLSTERGFVVFVIENGKAVSKTVTLGLRTSDGVEITEGLQGGEKVVTDGAAALRPGIEADIVGAAS